jgi:hypothetical protein
MLLLAATLSPAALAEELGLTVGPSFLGGTAAGGVTQLQVSRTTFVEGGVGLRPGWAVDQDRFYLNVAASLGVCAQFGVLPMRNGVFLNVASTMPLDSYEAWASGGWSMRVWGPKDQGSTTLDIGVAAYIVRDLPPGTDLGEVPVFLSTRVALHFPLVARGGNESVRKPKRGAEEE